MARTVTLNGTNYSVPEPSDVGYDSALTAYLVALATAFPQLNGTNGTLTAELDFGASFGIKSLYYKSRTANLAAAGQIRFGKTDTLSFRNNANGADLALGIDTGDALTFNGANVTGNPVLAATTVAGQSINSSAATIVVYGTVEVDSDSGYNAGTGRYTIPTGKGGHYVIAGGAALSAGSGTIASLSIYKNAAAVRVAGYVSVAASAGMFVSSMLSLTAGDIIDLRLFQNSGAPVTMDTTAGKNFFTLKRVPT